MPKVKTQSSAKKRFKVTGSGKIKLFRSGTSHLRRKKTTKAKRHLRGSTIVNTVESDRVLRMLGLKKS